MAVVKVGKGGKTLTKAIDYAAKENIVSGKDCSDNPNHAKEQMLATKLAWDQTDGRQYKHYIQSFKPGEVTPEQANEIGRKWAEKCFPGYEVVIGTHKDKEHIHNHIIVNSVNFENGKKIHLNKKDLEQFKTHSNEICKQYGLSTIDRTKTPNRGEVRAADMDKYRIIEQGIKGTKNSYLLETAQTINKSLETANTKEDFINKMESQGYTVEWKDTRKHITFIDRDGHKIRAANLEKTFSDPTLGKDGIIKRLEQNSQRHKEENQPEKMTVKTINKLLNRRLDEIKKELHTLRHQERMEKKKIITPERAMYAAKSILSQGESVKIAKEKSEIQKQRISLAELEREHAAKPKPGFFDIVYRKTYEKNTQKLAQLRAETDLRQDHNDRKMREMNQQMNTPDGQAKLQKVSKKLLEKNQSQQDKVNVIENKISSLLQEKEKIMEMKSQIPYKDINKEVTINWDGVNAKNGPGTQNTKRIEQELKTTRDTEEKKTVEPTKTHDNYEKETRKTESGNNTVQTILNQSKNIVSQLTQDRKTASLRAKVLDDDERELER